jgi:hypothetical protein
VTLALLTLPLGIKPTLGILVIPLLVTNAWQALQGGYLRELIGRLWLVPGGSGGHGLCRCSGAGGGALGCAGGHPRGDPDHQFDHLVHPVPHSAAKA